MQQGRAQGEGGGLRRQVDERERQKWQSARARWRRHVQRVRLLKVHQSCTHQGVLAGGRQPTCRGGRPRLVAYIK